MFTVCVGLVFRSEYVQFPNIFSLQYSININTVEVDPHSDLLHICIVKPKNIIIIQYIVLVVVNAAVVLVRRKHACIFSMHSLTLIT